MNKSLYTTADKFKLTTAKGKHIDHLYDFESFEDAISFIQSLPDDIDWQFTMIATAAGTAGEDVWISTNSKNYRGVFYD